MGNKLTELLRELRLKSLGKIPTNANDIEVESLLKNLREWVQILAYILLSFRLAGASYVTMIFLKKTIALILRKRGCNCENCTHANMPLGFPS